MKARLPFEVALGLLIGALSSYPSHWHLSASVSGSAALATLAAVVVGVQILFLPLARTHDRLPLLLWLWLGWSIASLLWGSTSLASLQNLFLYVAFIGTAAVVAAKADGVDAERVLRLTSIIGWIIAVTYLGEVLQSGTAQASAIGARGFALEGAILIGPAVVYARSYRPGLMLRLTPFVLLGTIVLSLSRTATVVAALAFAAAWAATGQPRGQIVRFVAAVAGGVAAFDWLITHYAPLHDRFTTGDNASLGGYSINTEGRAQAWSYLWHQVADTPPHRLAGHGVGAAAEAVSNVFGANYPQPHNDYLRLLFDVGWVGAALFVAGMLILTVRCLRRRTPVARAAGVAAFALLGCMSTDNPIVYPFCMLLVAVLVGLALASGNLRAVQRRATVMGDEPIPGRVTERRVESGSRS